MANESANRKANASARKSSSASSDSAASAAWRGRGRPRRSDAPEIPWPEVEKLLVFGEPELDGTTGTETRRYPTLAEVAKRYGVSAGTVWKFSKRACCFERRAEAQRRAQAKLLGGFDATPDGAGPATPVDVVAVVDEYLSQFGKRLREGQVRTDNAADFERFARLRELVTGKADSRQEIQGGISLEAIQSRHLAQLQQAARTDARLTGAQADDDEDSWEARRGR